MDNLESCAIIIYVGSPSEEWFEHPKREPTNKLVEQWDKHDCDTGMVGY